jgi:copper chaperone CopZ
MRTLIVLAVGFIIGSGTALACEGNPNCTMAACNATKTTPETEAETPAATVEGETVVIAVAGMTCGGCSDKVTKALKDTEGVNSATVSYKSGSATIRYEAKTTTPNQLVQVITNSGFKASLPE